MKNKLIVLITFIIICLMTLSLLFLIFEREERIIEIEELNEKNKKNDSITNIKINKLNLIIEKKNSLIEELGTNKEIVNGFKVGNRSISVDELLKMANETLNENSKLNNQIKEDKIIIKYIEDSYGIKVLMNDNGTISLKLNPDSTIKNFEKNTSERINKLENELEEKKYILQQLQKKYGFKYEVKSEDNKIKSTIYLTKLDSALWLYPHYKHKIKTDKQGNLIIK